MLTGHSILLALTWLLPAPAGAADAGCPSEQLDEGAAPGHVFDACIDEMSLVLGNFNELNESAGSEGRPGGPNGRETAKRFDAFSSKFSILRAYFEAHRNDAAVRDLMPFLAHMEVEFSNPSYKTIRDRFAPPTAAAEPAKDPTIAVAPKLPVTPEPTPQKREQAIERANAAEAQLALQPKPDPVQAVRVAKDFLRGAAPQDAERVLNRVIEDGQGDGEAYRLRGTARYQREDWPGAYADTQQALGRDPGDTQSRDLAGAARMMLNRLALKAPKLKLSAKEEDDTAGVAGATRWSDPTAKAGANAGDLGRWMADVERKVSIGDRREALLDLARILGRDPRHLRALTRRAYLLNRGPHPDPEAALHDADRALAVSPYDPAALRERAFALIQLGRAVEALALLETAIALEPANALGYLYRAKTYEALGLHEKALADYKKAAALDPALRSFYAEALAGSAAAEVRALPRPSPTLARRLAFLLGVPLFLWGLWRGLRLVSGATTRPRDEPAPPAGAPPETLSPGTVLAGAYRIERVLGRGGMGVVYEAEDLGLQRHVAVKQLRAPEGSAEDTARFLREARLVARISHERIVQIHALVEEGGRFYMVFERVAGRGLDAELAERGRLGTGEVLDVLRDVCAALEAAHGVKVIHRDLKPANIMRGGDGRCKVMDFGIAHQSSGSGQTRTDPWGTPPYMAPEQEQGRVCVETDLYALGCMTFELLTGGRPFAGSADKLARRFTRPAALVPGLPRALDAFMERALDPDPQRRFQTAGEFLKAFEGCLTDRIAA